MKAPGSSVGQLSRVTGAELGLEPGTHVSTSLIDAHAGALGMLAGCDSGVGKLGLVTGI